MFLLTSAVDIQRGVLMDPGLKEPLNVRTAACFSIEEKLVLKRVCLHHHFASSGPVTPVINSKSLSDILGTKSY